ncbi:hypothetical protein K443DRAFT_678040 [Laccaria amethystina LaAM-08-1]|uniref:Peptidase A1 domain-containing protein n=1 Tax=Laccaria amethystina LaAM-08-1 TaxID=1095629 RepID=A0A0C9XAD3_9AGAR|nr:hypothetical protein K443DRAFT_678040 [Laccaria amethystina LaAM-08-1]
MRSLIPLTLLIAVFHTPVHAVIFPVHIQVNRNPSPSLSRRSPVPIGNIGNAQYVSNITLAGVQLPVLLDTGSSDLWVSFPQPSAAANVKDTGKSLTLSYAVGKASGNIQTAQIQFGNYTVDDQAFLLVNDTSTFTSDIHSQGYDGLLGLGPNTGSLIGKKLSGSAGYSTLQRLFQQDKMTANYISFLLDRKNDPGETFTGQITISEVVPGFENITSMPQLDVETVSRILKGDQHWQALTDKNNGITGPDGLPIQLKSIVPNAPSGQFVAVVDSGFTFSQVPRDISDAIYGRVNGAYYDTQNEWWLVPCGQYLNVSFNFGGNSYPVHPLDLVDDNFSQIDSTGKKVCIGAFQPITSAFSILGHYDMILGMSFLRNTYTLLNFGDWIGTNGTQDHPFIQLASVTNVAAARNDFIQVRLGGNDTINDPKWALLPTSQMQHSPVSAEEKKKAYEEKILSRWPYILFGCLVFVLILLGLCIWRCCCRRGKKQGTGAKKGFFSRKGGGVFAANQKRSSYVPLSTPNRSAGPYPPQTAGAFAQSQQNLHEGYGHGGHGFSGHRQV